jgi:hypothetical protein
MFQPTVRLDITKADLSKLSFEFDPKSLAGATPVPRWKLIAETDDGKSQVEWFSSSPLICQHLFSVSGTGEGKGYRSIENGEKEYDLRAIQNGTQQLKSEKITLLGYLNPDKYPEHSEIIKASADLAKMFHKTLIADKDLPALKPFLKGKNVEGMTVNEIVKFGKSAPYIAFKLSPARMYEGKIMQSTTFFSEGTQALQWSELNGKTYEFGPFFKLDGYSMSKLGIFPAVYGKSFRKVNVLGVIKTAGDRSEEERMKCLNEQPKVQQVFPPFKPQGELAAEAVKAAEPKAVEPVKVPELNEEVEQIVKHDKLSSGEEEQEVKPKPRKVKFTKKPREEIEP